VLSGGHSVFVLAYQLLSDVAGIQDDPACNSYGGTDVLVHCAVRSVSAICSMRWLYGSYFPVVTLELY
jgi:hypothetical protein